MFSAFCHHSHIRGYIVKTDIYRHQYFFEKEEVFLCDVLPLHVEVSVKDRQSCLNVGLDNI